MHVFVVCNVCIVNLLKTIVNVKKASNNFNPYVYSTLWLECHVGAMRKTDVNRELTNCNKM